MSVGDLLFYGKDLRALIHRYEIAIKEEVERWDRNRILASSESDLVTCLVDQYTFDPPRLLCDQMLIEKEGEAKVDVSGRFEYGIWDNSTPHFIPGSFVTVAIPFEGDGDLFGFQVSTYSFNPPRGRVSGSNVLISFQDVKLDAEQTREEIDATSRADRKVHRMDQERLQRGERACCQRSSAMCSSSQEPSYGTDRHGGCSRVADETTARFRCCQRYSGSSEETACRIAPFPKRGV